MTFRHFFTFLGVLLALALVPVAQAANLFIDDSVEAQITLRHDANWEFGVVSNGVPFGPRMPGSTTVPGESATFSGTWFVDNPGNPDPGRGIIYFVDEVVNDDDDDDDDDDGNNPRFVVSDIVTAEWSTVVRPLLFDIATIRFTIQSSGCGQNLGPLPPHFAGHGVPDPASPIEISGLFRDPATAAPVAIPSNLTVQFVGKPDTACPGDDDDDDEDEDDDDDDEDDDEDDD